MGGKQNNTIVIVLAIAVVLLGAQTMGVIDIASYFGGSIAPGSGYGGFTGTVTLKANVYNKYDQSVDTMTTPVFVASHYYGHESSPAGGVAITYTGTDFDLVPQDGGKFWFKVNVGTVSFQLPEEILSLNPTVVSSQWLDPSGTGRSSQYLLVDISKISAPNPNVKPAWILNVPDIDEDVAGITQTYVSGNSTAHSTDAVAVLTCKLVGLSVGAGMSITGIYVTDNATTRAGAKGTAQELIVQGWGINKVVNNPVASYDTGSAGGYAAYYLKPVDNTEWQQGWEVMRPTNEADLLLITCNYRINAPVAGLGYTVTINVTFCDAEGVTTTIAQQFAVSNT